MKTFVLALSASVLAFTGYAQAQGFGRGTAVVYGNGMDCQLDGIGPQARLPRSPRHYAAKLSKGNKELSDQTANAAFIFSRYIVAGRR